MSAALAAGEPSHLCLREWLLLLPDPRKRAGRWHPLQFVLALPVCAFTAAGHDSPSAIAEWAAGCPRQALLLLGGRPDPLTGRVRPPSTRTFRRVFAKISADALSRALYGFVEVMPPAAPQELPEVARHEREQRLAGFTCCPLAGTDAQFADTTWTGRGKATTAARNGPSAPPRRRLSGVFLSLKAGADVVQGEPVGLGWRRILVRCATTPWTPCVPLPVMAQGR